MPLAPQKEANGREEAVLEWVALEAVAVNVRQALELAVTAEAVLDEPAAVVLGLVLRERVLREQAHRDRVHREAVPQELGVLAQRVQADLAEVENLVIEADKCSGHDSCADVLH
jgi:glycine cleavage system pyridoxal-binding protein P